MTAKAGAGVSVAELSTLPEDDLRRRVMAHPVPRHVAIIMDGNGRWAQSRGLPVVLHDPALVEGKNLADLYGAQTTPHVYVIDRGGILAYQGAWNDISLRKKAASEVYAAMAVEALMAGRQPPVTQTAPYGCVLVRFAV